MTDTEAAEAEAWKRLAEAVLDHDVIREAFALADLRRLLPEQRQP